MNSKRQVKGQLGHVAQTNVCRFALNVNSKSLFFFLLDKGKNNIKKKLNITSKGTSCSGEN